jgi:hypothetical protein
MKKQVKLAGIAAIIGCMTMVACEKDDSGSSTGTTSTTSATTSGSKIDLLTGGSTKSWRVSAYYYNDSIESIEPCEADDRYTFTKAGKTYTVNLGTLKCDPSETGESGTWDLKNNDTELEIDEFFTLTIQELTASKLVFISYDTTIEEQPGGGTDTTIVTSKQVWVNP